MRNRSLDFGRQNALNVGEDLFFLEITCFWTEKRSEFASIQLKKHKNLGKLRLRLNQTSKKSLPPFAKFWLRDCVKVFLVGYMDLSKCGRKSAYFFMEKQKRKKKDTE